MLKIISFVSKILSSFSICIFVLFLFVLVFCFYFVVLNFFKSTFASLFSGNYFIYFSHLSVQLHVLLFHVSFFSYVIFFVLFQTCYDFYSFLFFIIFSSFFAF